MKQARIPLTLLLALGFLAPEVAEAKKSPPPKATVKEGKLQVVRGIRRREAQLTDGAGKRCLLVGVLRKELLRLHGHRVRVEGTLAPSKDPAKLDSFTVTRYELLARDGKQPQLGWLERRAGKLVLTQADRKLKVIAKAAMTKRLRRVVGCKVWLVGELQQDTINVSKFGRITCDKKPPIKAKKEKSK